MAKKRGVAHGGWKQPGDLSEHESRERRRAMIAGARAKAKDVTLDGRTFKLVKLPPELGSR